MIMAQETASSDDVHIPTAGQQNHIPPPDGGYGWVCVVAVFLVNCFSWGIVASYGVYLSYYLSISTIPGLRPRDVAFIGGLNFAAAMIVSPIVTTSSRKYGIHVTMSVGVILQSTGYATASLACNVWHLYLTQGLLVGLGVGFVYIPSTAVISQWFEKKRSLANGITATGSGVGGAAFTWGTGAMIDSLSVAWSLRITAILAFAATATATALLRDRNQHIRPPQLAFDTRLLHRLDVWLLLSWAFISMLGYIVLLYSLGDFATDLGLSQDQSTNVIGLLNIGTAVGRPLIGIWGDRFRRLDVAAMLTILNGVLCFSLWVPATTYALTIVFAILTGAIVGVFWMTIGPLCVEVVGLEDLPSLLSISWLTIVLPTAFSEVIALELRRQTTARPYLYTQIFAGMSFLVAGFILCYLARLKLPSRR